MGNKFSLSLSTKLSIGLFLCIGFGFLSLLTVAMGMYNAAGSVSRGYEAEKARNATISTTEGSLATEVILAERAALGDNDLRDALRPKIEALQSTADQSKSLNRSGLDGAITKFNTVLNGVFSKDSAERLNAAHDLGLSYQSEILGQLADARQQSVELAHNGQAAVNQNRAFAASLAFAFFLCAAGMGGLCRWQLKNRLFKPLAIIDSRLVSLRDAVDSRLKFGLSHLAEGDLSIRVETALPSLNFGTNDEMGQLAKTYNAIAQDIEAALTAYNSASSGLNELVSQVAESADLVHNTAQSVSQAAQESGSASREIAGGSEQLAVNSTEAAKIIDGLAKQSNDVSDGCATQLNLVGQVDQSLNEAASGVTDLASNAQHMSAMATEGNQAVREAVNAMNSVREKVLFSAQKVRELDQKGQQIGAIVATIDQIAEQTNLLALNAAIEAARAGEHGRGFAIVAEEVRKLAEQSSASTHEIAELIQSIRQTVHESVKAIEITATDSEAGADRSSRAGQILADVQTAANSVSSQAERLTILTHQAANSMREVAVATRSNAESAKAMVKGTNLVANTIMEVASFSEQSAAGAQELTAAVSEVGQSARKLDELGIELQSAVSKFQLELQPKEKRLRLAS